MTKTKAKSEKKGISEELSLIEKGIKELSSSEKWIQYLKFQAHFHNYSFNNTLLILMQCENASKVTGFKTWNKVGRHVKKGEKAIKILAPRIYKVEKEVENEKGEKETVEQKKMVFVSVPVFDLSQTEGEELPTLVDKLEGNTELYEIATSVCPFPISEEVITGGANGYYNKLENRIAIKHDNPELHKLKTLIHEWGHGLLHASMDDETPRDIKELEAESVAFIVCHRLGLDTSGYSFAYLSSWGGGEGAIGKIKESCERIQKTSNEILSSLEESVNLKKEVKQIA
jgi:antirestriction protein ArdC